MSHFAKVLDGKVVKVIVAEKEFFDTFIDDSPGDWIQTSFNVINGVYLDPVTNQPVADQVTPFKNHPERNRKNMAAVGMIYDSKRDMFYFPSPYPSWVLNEDKGAWEAPTPKPPHEESSVGDWAWNEEEQKWIEFNPMPQ